MDISADQANQVAEAEMADIDQFRPAKKPKVEAGSLTTTEEVREELAEDDEDWDDIYGTNSKEAERASGPSAVEHQVGSAAVLPMTTQPTASGIKPEDQEDVHMSAPKSEGTLPLAAPGVHEDGSEKPTTHNNSNDDLTATMADAGEDELVDESKMTVEGVDEASSRMIQETSELEQKAETPGGDKPVDAVPTIQTHTPRSDTAVKAEPNDSADAEFAAAAMAQRGNPEAEFEWDSSSDDSSSDESSSDDDDSDDEAESMDAETMAKILMAEDGNDGGDGDGKTGANHQPRTQNEVDSTIPTPDVIVMPDMKITELGKIEHFVELKAVVRGNTSATDEVMEIGSLLCNEHRQVIGVIQETLGKVQEPMYTLVFDNEAEFEQLGLQAGSIVYYVNEHSRTTFTEGLRTKGTDASNIHDEEIAEDEEEFSDDEQEAEYKRKSRESKKAGRGPLSRGAFNRGEHKQYEPDAQQDSGRGRGGRNNRGRGRGGSDGPRYPRGAPGMPAYDKPRNSYPSALNYDDEPKAGADDDGYTVLKRPDNMSQLQQMAGPPPTERYEGVRRSSGDRGRGRGRGRGDRQGREHGQRQGRGGHGNQQQQHAGFPGMPPTNMPPHYPQPAAQPYFPYNYPQAQQPYAAPQQAYQQPQQAYPPTYQQPYGQPQQQTYAQPAQAQPAYAPSQAAQAPTATPEQMAQYAQQNPEAWQQYIQQLHQWYSSQQQ